MKITYLGHSGFLLELDKVYFLFDYHTGQIPPLNPDKELYIFVSHAHGDHYNREIWGIRKSHFRVRFIVSKDIPLSASQKLKLGLTEQDEKRITRVKADEMYRLSSDLSVETLLSTDEGIAFIINYGKKTFFHAGDLNLWTWPGDEEQANCDRFRRFMIEMEKIRGRVFDVAFFPLDPRQEEACGDGFRIFQQITETEELFPMHMWGNFAVTNSYIEKYPDESDNVVIIEYEGQVFGGG
ncbi:MAG: MBL fold metallo-hydrolase [Lachnospiraceae bacterium]|nr:MBL fold metallo-hydrolase [Lachnospiraceae bacterium]